MHCGNCVHLAVGAPKDWAMLPERAEKSSQRRQMSWTLKKKQLAKGTDVGQGVPTRSFIFTVQTSPIAHAGGEAVHPCPLVTVLVTTEDLAPWRAAQDSPKLYQGQGCFWAKCQLPNISSNLFVLFWLLPKVPYHLLYCWVWGGSTLE